MPVKIVKLSNFKKINEVCGIYRIFQIRLNLRLRLGKNLLGYSKRLGYSEK